MVGYKSDKNTFDFILINLCIDLRVLRSVYPEFKEFISSLHTYYCSRYKSNNKK